MRFDEHHLRGHHMTMTSTTHHPGVGATHASRPAPPSQQETIEDLLIKAKRDAVPIRNRFVQQGRGKATRPGPLAAFVSSQDARGLRTYLLIRALISSGDRGWSCTYPSQMWVRALALGEHAEEDSARSAVSKVFSRLIRRSLIERSRANKLSSLTILREDGSGADYTHPGTVREAHFKLPHAFWTEGHYNTLTLPGIAVLLIALSLPNDFYLPFSKAKAWYGIGEETAQDGMRQLVDLGLITFRVEWIMNQSAKDGWQSQRYYTLVGSYSSAARASKKTPGAKRAKPAAPVAATT